MAASELTVGVESSLIISASLLWLNKGLAVSKDGVEVNSTGKPGIGIDKRENS
jgi:hypothetical protein